MVLFAMTLASALAVGGAYVSRQLAVTARFANRASEVLPAAEGVLVLAIANWDSAARNAQAVGSVAPLPVPAISGPATEAWVTRASDRLYWLLAEASSPDRPSVRWRIGLLVRVSGGVPTLVPLRAWSELP